MVYSSCVEKAARCVLTGWSCAHRDFVSSGEFCRNIEITPSLAYGLCFITLQGLNPLLHWFLIAGVSNLNIFLSGSTNPPLLPSQSRHCKFGSTSCFPQPWMALDKSYKSCEPTYITLLDPHQPPLPKKHSWTLVFRGLEHFKAGTPEFPKVHVPKL